MRFRGFIAADLPTTDRLEPLVRELRTSGAPLKLVATGQLHATLKFLGDTEEGLVDDIVEAIRAACRGVPPFSLSLRGTGAFPSLSRMNVVWVGLEGAEPLGRIAALLDTGLEPLGFRRESRAWAPHATLARVKGGRNLDRVRQILFVSMCFEPKTRGKKAFMVPLAHRQYFPREFEALLHYNGFETTALYGDFERGPLVQSSDVMVFHARRRRP